jgi:hypothetical protein
VIEHNADIRPKLFAALVDQYWEMRDLVIECLIDEDPDTVVPKITNPEDLAPLCGMVALPAYWRNECCWEANIWYRAGL